MLYVPKITLGRTSLVCGVHCYSIFYFFCLTSISVLLRTHTHTHTHTHTYDNIQTVHELLLLANNTAGETFVYNSGTVRIVDWMFVTGAPVWW